MSDLPWESFGKRWLAVRPSDLLEIRTCPTQTQFGETMKRTIRTEVFVETEVEIEVKRRTRRLAPVWCEACGAEVEMAPPDVIAAVAEVSARAIFDWVNEGIVHFAETPEGALLVCLPSLPGAAGLRRTSSEAADSR
jgi:hypothetical protein